MPKKSKTVYSNGAKTDFQLRTIRLHTGNGIDTVSGANDSIQDVYCGTDIDPEFACVRFYDSDGVTQLKYRRFNKKKGISADFIIKIPSIPASGVTNIFIEYSPNGLVTASTDEAVDNFFFDTWVRLNETGVFGPQFGLECTVWYNTDMQKWQLWMTHEDTDPRYPPPTKVYPFINTGIGYTECDTWDGNWPHPEYCVTGIRGSQLKIGPDGKYHLIGYPGVDTAYDMNLPRYYRSDTGKNGTFTFIGNLIPTRLPGNGGNAGLYWDADGYPWLHLDYNDGTTFQNIFYKGNKDWTNFVQVPNAQAAPEVNYNPYKKMPTTWGMRYTSVPQSRDGYVPTESFLGAANNGPTPPILQGFGQTVWGLKLLPKGATTGQPTNYDSQIGDLRVVDFNGQTLVFYEECNVEKYEVPNMCVSWLDMPSDQVLNPAINTNWCMDDLDAEGWYYETGCDDPWWEPSDCSYPLNYFRKFTKFNHGKQPTSLCVHTETHPIKARKNINLTYTENDFHFIAWAEQTNKKFIPFQIASDFTHPLAGILFDSDGFIKYYNGSGLTPIKPYIVNQDYEFKLGCHTSGYDVYCDDMVNPIAINVSYINPFSKPTKFRIEMQDVGGQGWVNTLYTTQYSSAQTAPTWGSTVQMSVGTPSITNNNSLVTLSSDITGLTSTDTPVFQYSTDSNNWVEVTGAHLISGTPSYGTWQASKDFTSQSGLVSFRAGVQINGTWYWSDTSQCTLAIQITADTIRTVSQGIKITADTIRIVENSWFSSMSSKSGMLSKPCVSVPLSSNISSKSSTIFKMSYLSPLAAPLATYMSSHSSLLNTIFYTSSFSTNTFSKSKFYSYLSNGINLHTDIKSASSLRLPLKVVYKIPLSGSLNSNSTLNNDILIDYPYPSSRTIPLSTQIYSDSSLDNTFSYVVGLMGSMYSISRFGGYLHGVTYLIPQNPPILVQIYYEGEFGYQDLMVHTLVDNTIRLTAKFMDIHGNMYDPTNVYITVYKSITREILFSQQLDPSIYSSDTGVYCIDYCIPDESNPIIYEFKGEIDFKPVLGRRIITPERIY